MMNRRDLFLLFLALVSLADAFAPVSKTTTSFAVPSNPTNPSLFSQHSEFEDPPLVLMIESEHTSGGGWMGSRVASKCAGLISGLSGFVARGMAEDLEYAELPPPYVPALFGVVLLAGIGVLTASLGDVMTEEANLGLQSGARAKKEIERSRSSYFKRR